MGADAVEIIAPIVDDRLQNREGIPSQTTLSPMNDLFLAIMKLEQRTG